MREGVPRPSACGVLVVAVLAAVGVGCMPPEWGAAALVQPARRRVPKTPTLPYREFRVAAEDAEIVGWLFPAPAPAVGTLVYLHGVSDNRGSGVGVAARFVPKGWDVAAFDARAHGESSGAYCTYGYRERHDVGRVLSEVGARRAVLFGSSLGAAVALQAASVDGRVRGVIAQSPFSDLPTIVAERAPFYATRAEVAEALRLAEKRAGFRAEDVSPARAAAAIRVPVLLIHGVRDRTIRADHSRRIADALAGPKRLLLVPGGHDDALAAEDTWRAIEDWLAALSVAWRGDLQ